MPRFRIMQLLLGVWVAALVVLFSTHHTFIAILVIAVPLGILKYIADQQNRISKVGVKGQAGLGCPKCGGTQWKAKRSAGGKVALGLLASKTRVRCETCGAQYVRG